MESIGKVIKFQSKKPKKQSDFVKFSANDTRFGKDEVKVNPHLHSPNHLLADELSVKLNDRKHFAFYLKMAVLYDHNYLRNLAGQIMESKTVQTPGRLFAFLIKKNNLEKKKPETA
jgi:hypothetical protein